MRFVGRATELSALRAEAGLARAGRCRIVLVTGDAGVGKSRLLEEFGRELSENFRYVRGSCVAVPDAVPLWPWRNVLAALGETISIEASAGDNDSFATRARYAEALVRAVEAGPALVVLDDLHRADAATLALLTHLAEVAPDAPLLITVAYRDECAPTLPAGPAVSRTALRGLAVEEVAELVAQVVGAAVPAGVASQLRRRTDGNPRLLIEIAAQLDPSALGTDGPDRLTIVWPPEVRSSAEARLAVLTPASRDVLVAAAVIGREFDLALLERIAAPAGGDLLGALDEAVRHGLITPRAGQVYAFARAIDREILYETHGVRERAHLHEAAAAALLAFSAFVDERGPTVEELAHHLVNAAVLGGADRLDLAVAYAVAAGTRATQRGRAHDAVAHHADALRLAIRAGWPQPAVGRLLVGLGVARLAAGEPAAGRESLTAAARLGRRCDDAGLLAAAALGHGPRAGAGETAAPPDRGLLMLLTEAAHRLAAADSSIIARLHARIAIELAGTPEAEPHARTATDAARECADPRAVAEACLARAAVAALAGTPAGPGEVDLRPALRAAVALEDTILESRARLAAATAALARADIATADRELAAVAAVRDQSGQPYALWCAELAAAHRGLLAGDLATTERLAARAATHGRRTAPAAAQRAHAVQLAAAGLARGSLAGVAPALAGLSRGEPPPAWLPALSAAVALEQQEHAVAAALLAEEIGESPEPARLWRLCVLAEVAAELADQPAVAHLVPLLQPYAHGWIVIGPAVANAGPVALALARLHLAAGELRAAEAALDQAAATVGTTVWVAHLRLARARWLVARGRPEDRAAAVKQARAARLFAAGADLVGLARRADVLIAELAASSGVGLTRREQEVATLAIRGVSAREIAEHLVVGERTVETHLANIYRKLGVRSRVELMARFGRPSADDLQA